MSVAFFLHCPGAAAISIAMEAGRRTLKLEARHFAPARRSTDARLPTETERLEAFMTIARRRYVETLAINEGFDLK